jgi:Icc protein
MGHTHYDEIANDSQPLCSTSRSTGQIQEGPVGHSVTDLDGTVLSWRFVEFGKLPIAVITSPSVERLLTKSSEIPQDILKVRAKFWGEAETLEATVDLGGQTLAMERLGDSHIWESDLPTPSEETHPWKVTFKDAHGEVASDEIRLAVGHLTERKSEERDQDNALEAWPAHGLLGTQLGSNKNGKKW